MRKGIIIFIGILFVAAGTAFLNQRDAKNPIVQQLQSTQPPSPATLVSREILTNFADEHSRLVQKAKLAFPTISQVSSASYESLPEEVKGIILADATHLSVNTLRYTGGSSGFFIGGRTFPRTMIELTQLYATKIRSVGWRTVMGAYTEEAMIREFNNEQYEARAVFLKEEAGTIIFGLLIRKTDAL